MISWREYDDEIFDAPPWRDTRSIELLSRSHGDVSAHDRNIDEKVRSLLTALAFLTVAGVTLFIYSNPHANPNDLTFDGRSWNAANVFFIFFLTSLILSLMAALVAVDPRSFRPHFLVPRHDLLGAGKSAFEAYLSEFHRRYGERVDLDHSVLYSTDIAQAECWRRHATSPASVMQENIWRSLAVDTLELARRTLHKERRLGDAQGFIFMAMVNLGLMGVVRLPSAANTTRAWIVVIAVVVLPFFLAPATLWFMARDDYVDRSDLGLNFRDLLLLYGMPSLIVLTLGIWAVFFGGSYWMTIFAGIAAVLTTSHPSVILFFSLIKQQKTVDALRSFSRWTARRAVVRRAVRLSIWALTVTGVLPLLRMLTAPFCRLLTRRRSKLSSSARTAATAARALLRHVPGYSRVARGVRAWRLQWLVWPAIGVAALVVPALHLDPRLGPGVHLKVGYIAYSKSSAVACATVQSKPFDGLRLDVIENGRRMKTFPQALIVGATGHALIRIQLYGHVSSQSVEFHIRHRDTDVTETSRVATDTGARKTPPACKPSQSSKPTGTTNRAVSLRRW